MSARKRFMKCLVTIRSILRSFRSAKMTPVTAEAA